MSIFLHRHPSASPKVKKYINQFEKIANEFQDEYNDFHANTQKLDDKFKTLAHGLKHALVSRSAMSRRPPREKLFDNAPQTEKANTFITDHIPLPVISKKKIQPKIIQPKKCNPVSKTMPIRPVYGAYKYYDSNATREMKLEEEELMMEIRNYPQLEYEYRTFTDMKKVDPYFHIGGFPREVLLRSPDERVYTHVQSSGHSNNSNEDNNDYLHDPSSYYIENDGNYYIEKKNEYPYNDSNDNINNENGNNQYVQANNHSERNQYDDDEIFNTGKIYNNRRKISTR